MVVNKGLDTDSIVVLTDHPDTPADRQPVRRNIVRVPICHTRASMNSARVHPSVLFRLNCSRGSFMPTTKKTRITIFSVSLNNLAQSQCRSVTNSSADAGHGGQIKSPPCLERYEKDGLSECTGASYPCSLSLFLSACLSTD